ncbi:hypothetical protein Cgig2_013426 [Carnegiea gigantea]|uniref:Uncharacterized protein n=1 Tax=Carnegiea gigantea TaxID=171969 RepID=A0A9Q1JYZ6_9CARY|nr:hypothetical protein Cgig2_013426 [Carnegiea gigantea]
MEIMFSNTFATGEHSWDLYALEVNENGGRAGEGEDEAVEEEKNIEVIKNVRAEDSGYDDCGVPNICLENMEVDNVDSVEQDCNKTEKNLVLRKGKKNQQRGLSTAEGMQSRLDRIVEAAKSCIPHFTATSVSNDLPDCSIAECMRLLKTLPFVELGSELYILGACLFIKQQYREMFIALEEDGMRVAWLEDELELIKEGKRTSRH